MIQFPKKSEESALWFGYIFNYNITVTK
jgi:hypothetical protein